MERYFSDSLLGRGVSLWYIHKKESILEGADADQHADPVENQHELHMGKDFVSLVKGIMKRLKKLVRKQYDALTHIDFRDKTHKAILRIVIVNFVILVVVELVSLMCGFEFYALVIYSIVLFLILRKFFRDVQRKYQMLLHATNELAEGNLDVVIEGDAGVFMPIQKELCRIQQGFKKAVDEEVKMSG